MSASRRPASTWSAQATGSAPRSTQAPTIIARWARSKGGESGSRAASRGPTAADSRSPAGPSSPPTSRNAASKRSMSATAFAASRAAIALSRVGC
ncbi:hypothetical protein ACFQ0M_26565 [Kitasatospora aburaviensis]